jgi:hypothetical protein
LPILAQLQARSSQEPFTIAPVALDTAPIKAETFVRSLHLGAFSTFKDPRGLLRAEPDPVFPLFGMPMAYVIDRHGFIAGYLIGAVDWSSGEAISLLRHYGLI